MADARPGTHLTFLVDDLWKSPHRALRVGQLVADLNEVDMLLLAGWDTAATCGPLTGTLRLTLPQTIEVTDDVGRVFLLATLVETHQATDHSCLITYWDTPQSVVLDKASPNTPTGSTMHDPKGLLLALQLIRDHLDSVLLKPRDLRDQEIAEFAAAAGLQEEHFRRLASWFHTLTPYLRREGA